MRRSELYTRAQPIDQLLTSCTFGIDLILPMRAFFIILFFLCNSIIICSFVLFFIVFGLSPIGTTLPVLEFPRVPAKRPVGLFLHQKVAFPFDVYAPLQCVLSQPPEPLQHSQMAAAKCFAEYSPKVPGTSVRA